MKTVRIGVLGSGFISELYLQALQHVPGTEVVVNYSRDIRRAKGFARRWHVPDATDRLKDVVSRTDLDLVLIGLPNFMHEEAVLALARAGKAMVCDKPLGRNAAEARRMLSAVQKAGVFHGYAESEVFTPAVTRARELVASGAIGRVLTFRGYEAHGGPHGRWFWDKKLAGGGVLLDMGCHSIEAARHFFGKSDKPEAVLAWGDTLVHKKKTRAEDNAVVLIRFASGGLAEIAVSWTALAGLDMRNEIYGSQGSVYTDIPGGSPVKSFTLKSAGYTVEKAATDRGWQFPVPDEFFSFGYVHELRHFVDCLRRGRKPLETFADGLIVNEIMDAAYSSMRSGRWIKIHV